MLCGLQLERVQEMSVCVCVCMVFIKLFFQFFYKFEILNKKFFKNIPFTAPIRQSVLALSHQCERKRKSF